MEPFCKEPQKLDLKGGPIFMARSSLEIVSL